MAQTAGLVVSLEEDLGLSNLASENDQRTSVSFCHLGLIRIELGFLGELSDEILVPPPGIPTRIVIPHMKGGQVTQICIYIFAVQVALARATGRADTHLAEAAVEWVLK